MYYVSFQSYSYKFIKQRILYILTIIFIKLLCYDKYFIKVLFRRNEILMKLVKISINLSLRKFSKRFYLYDDIWILSINKLFIQYILHQLFIWKCDYDRI